ncbi:hypothetical protein [Paraburkholderia sp. JHI869]|uniref:hypothetical protein n=1 Tax=Paraburkholderia sp. JHI869 TaxID=3112959 RepID=UPI00317AE98C
MENAKNPRQPDPLRVAFAHHTIVSYHVQAVLSGLTALDLAEKYDPLSRFEIIVEGERTAAHTGVLTVHVQTVTSMAAIYSRLLLEFLGLRSFGKPSTLVNLRSRKDGDIGVEHYKGRDGIPLTMVSPSIVEGFSDPAVVERSWTTVCDFAGQRLAHLTDDNKLNNTDVTPMLRRAFETIPELVSRTFFDRIG